MRPHPRVPRERAGGAGEHRRAPPPNRAPPGRRRGPVRPSCGPRPARDPGQPSRGCRRLPTRGQQGRHKASRSARVPGITPRQRRRAFGKGRPRAVSSGTLAPEWAGHDIPTAFAVGQYEVGRMFPPNNPSRIRHQYRARWCYPALSIAQKNGQLFYPAITCLCACKHAPCRHPGLLPDGTGAAAMQAPRSRVLDAGAGRCDCRQRRGYLSDIGKPLP
jgi:hypothetical protein